jgi:hypothetical protein
LEEKDADKVPTSKVYYNRHTVSKNSIYHYYWALIKNKALLMPHQEKIRAGAEI